MYTTEQLTEWARKYMPTADPAVTAEAVASILADDEADGEPTYIDDPRAVTSPPNVIALATLLAETITV